MEERYGKVHFKKTLVTFRGTNSIKIILWVSLICLQTVWAHSEDLLGHCRPISLKPVSETLSNPQDPCYAWVNALYGRILKVSFASGAIWTRHTGHGAGLVVTARHVLKDAPSIPGRNIPGFFGLPEPEAYPDIFTFLPLEGARGISDLRNQSFRLLATEITRSEYENNYVHILPKSDFVIGIFTNRKLRDNQVSFDPIDTTPIQIRDPHNLTHVEQIIVSPIENELTIVFGYPQGPQFNGEMVYSVGEVLSSTEADKLIKGSDEQSIPYNGQYEFVISARGLVGMSGGGVFNRRGEFLGTAVRASLRPINNLFYIRTVKADYMADYLDIEYQKLSKKEQKQILPFLWER